MENIEDNNVVEHLRRFWKHESLGLHDINGDSETQLETVQSKHLKIFDIQKRTDRYEVSLPWKIDTFEDSLHDDYDLCLGCVKMVEKQAERETRRSQGI